MIPVPDMLKIHEIGLHAGTIRHDGSYRVVPMYQVHIFTPGSACFSQFPRIFKEPPPA